MKIVAAFLTCFIVGAFIGLAYHDALQETHGLHAAARSSKWPEVRAAHLKLHPVCEVCGEKRSLQVHHRISFSVDASLELDPANLITLCDSPSCKSHLTIGHLGNYTLSNPHVGDDAALLKSRREDARK